MKRLSICLLAIVTLTGCVNFTDHSGTRHYVVFGFGVVSISRTNEPVQVIKSSVIGAEIQTLPVGITAGYRSSVEILAATNANADIEIKNLPLKSINVTIKQ